MKKSKVYLIGAGPGKADLITVRGMNILREADVIIHDYLVDKELLEKAPSGTEIICCGKLAHKGKYSYGHPVEQEIVESLVIDKVKEGKKVVRLKNGDPAFFSRFSEELRALIEAGIEFEVVPGVTAAGAASGMCGIPLTDRDHASSCVFATGHKSGTAEGGYEDWGSLAENGTLVIYMGVGNLAKVIKQLIDSGKTEDTPVAVIKNISLISQKILKGTLSDIAGIAQDAGLSPPAVIIIGAVAGMEKEFNWWQVNKKVLFTGLSEERYFLEGNYVYIPLIEIKQADNYDELDDGIKNIEKYDWVIFTSRYGVKYFFERMEVNKYDARKLSGAKIAVIGGSTEKKLNGHGLKADLIPKNESSEGLIEEFKKINLKGQSIFMPRSDISDKGLEKRFMSMGAMVTAPVAYKNVMPKDLPEVDLSDFNEIVFTSPSTVRNFRKRYGLIPEGIDVTCIGDVTEKEYGRIYKKQESTV